MDRRLIRSLYRAGLMFVSSVLGVLVAAGAGFVQGEVFYAAITTGAVVAFTALKSDIDAQIHTLDVDAAAGSAK